MTDQPSGTAGRPASQEPEQRASAFVAGLPMVSDPTRRETTFAGVGLVLMCLGLVVAVLAVILSQASQNPLDQSTQLTMAVAGLAVTAFGGVLFLRFSLGRLLRFWLLRMLHEQATRHNGP
jgi:uncharacterized membrane protein